MPKTFFKSWALWEKLTFVLACAIVPLPTAYAYILDRGFSRLCYVRWKLKKYDKLLERKRLGSRMDVEAAAMPVSCLESRPRNKTPFGIRAIESGIEVEGVWISRPNSPVPSNSGSSSVPLLTRCSNGSAVQLGSSRLGSLSSSARASRSTLESTRFPSTQVSAVNPRSLMNSSQDKARQMTDVGERLHHPSNSKPAMPVSSDSVGLRSGPQSLLKIDLTGSDDMTAGSGMLPHGFRISEPHDTKGHNTEINDPDITLFERRRLTHAASSGQLVSRSRPASNLSKSSTANSSAQCDDSHSSATQLSADAHEAGSSAESVSQQTADEGQPEAGLQTVDKSENKTKIKARKLQKRPNHSS